MTISKRSVARLMRPKAPKMRFSNDAVLMLKMHLENRAQQITEKAVRIHESENLMRKKLGEREKKMLAPRHMIAAIEGRFSEGEEANGEH